MSELSKIWTDIKGFFGKIFGSAPGVIKDIQIAIAGLVPIVDAAEPALAPEINAASTLVVNGLSELDTVITDYKSGSTTTGSLISAFEDVDQNLSGILTNAQIKNSTKIATITNVVTAAQLSLSTLQSSLIAVAPGTTVAPAAAPVPPAPVPPQASTPS